MSSDANPIFDDGIPASLQSNVLTLVATSDEYCLRVVDEISLHLYTNDVIRAMAAQIYDYVTRYGKAPGLGHLPDIVEGLLKDKNKGEMIASVLQDMHELIATGFNELYVADQLDKYKAHQQAKVTTTRVFEATEAGNTEAVDKAVDDYNRQREMRGKSKGVVIIRASDVRIEPIEWLWDGWLARSEFEILAGPPSAGKTNLAMYFAAVISRGGRWPDNTRCITPADVLIWTGEDSIEHTLTPRLLKMGANLDRVGFLSGYQDENEKRPFDPARDMKNLDRALSKLNRDIGLLILDPIVSAVAGDSHKNAETRRSLQPVVDAAKKLNCALLGISHVTKGTQGREPLERIIGSIAFGAVPRIAMAAAKLRVAEDGGRERVLVRAKSNIGPDGGGFCYSLERGPIPGRSDIETTSVRWCGEAEGTAKEILDAAERDKPKPSQFLTELLGSGPMLEKAVVQAAQEQGFTEKQMQNAATHLKVERDKTGFEGGWEWALPDPANPKKTLH